MRVSGQWTANERRQVASTFVTKLRCMLEQYQVLPTWAVNKVRNLAKYADLVLTAPVDELNRIRPEIAAIHDVIEAVAAAVPKIKNKRPRGTDLIQRVGAQ